MTRIKITENFYLDEFIHPDIYKRFGATSQQFLRPELVELCQFIREELNSPITINNWATGGSFINSGLRCYKNPLGKLNYSRHYFGVAADLKFSKLSVQEAYARIIADEELYMDNYLTTLEDINYTPTWLHVSVEWTDLDEIKIIKP